MRPSHWSSWYEKKPVPLVDYVVEEAAKWIAEALRQWPPNVEKGSELDETLRVPAFTRSDNKPSAHVLREAFALTQMELQHRLEAYEDYMRNERWLERGLSSQDKPTLLELSRWLLENLYTLQEATEGRLRRQQLMNVLQKVSALTRE